MKVIKRIILPILFICYFFATTFESDFWGNLLSPTITLIAFTVIFKAFYINQTKRDRLIGLLISFSILSWAMADILWAILDMIYNINPEEISLIANLYSLTNLFLALSLVIFGFYMFRKWNIIQMILDTIVMSFLTIDFIWIVFLKEDVTKVLELRSDWTSSTSIILDVLVITAVIVWSISVRMGRFPLYMSFIAAGSMLYSITDLVYYYHYLYCTYKPNSIIDAIYVLAFLLITIAAFLRMDSRYTKEEINNVNSGQKGKGYVLLLAPVLLIIFNGFDVSNLLQFVFVILIYSMTSSYVQKNIYKEGLLRKELELNYELEQKVKARTEELEESNKTLQHLINQDYITGLFNRRYLLTYLEEACHNLEYDETVVLLYIDINRFKMIKTMFEQYVGETILFEFAKKLKPMEKLASKSILASYGDDAYIFAAIGPYDYQNGRYFAEEAIGLSSDIYHVGEYQISITMDIGISIFPLDAITQEDLIKHADIAMTQARAQGFNMIRDFDLKLSRTFIRKSNIELMLKKANYNKELMVYYQPQLLTKNKKLVGFEALLRWKTATGEFISPAEFIPIAEETGCIIPIGEWVMKSVMQQLIDWNNYFDEKVMIGINVSLKQLNSAEFFDRLKEEIDRLEVKPEWIDLEITESFQLAENPDMIRMFEDIRKLGVKVSVDDFGTGYSSLSYLKDLPVDRIKLAKELINFVHTDDFDYQLVKSIIQLSKIKGIKVIAEGVETKEQWETLKDLECDEVQGFLFGKPEPAHEIEATFGNLLMGKLNNIAEYSY